MVQTYAARSESIVIMMIFMVIFLSGLANGLARAVSASNENENEDAKYYAISNDTENLIGTSSLSKEVLQQVASGTRNRVTNLAIKRTTLMVNGEGKHHGNS